MPRRSAPKVPSSQRGLGWAEHRLPRAEALPRFVGTTCPCTGCGKHRGRCRVVLTARNMEWDHEVARALGGRAASRFLCRSCNRSRGAALGNAMRARRAKIVRLVRSNSW